jgi:phosphate transport system substrate-binding protein
MWNRRQFFFFLRSSLVLAAIVSTGCNYKGEEPVAEKDVATSSTVKTAIGAGGSTFIAPIMNNWIAAYQQLHPGILINYRPIGSGAGLDEFKKTLLGFAASDAPLSDEQIRDIFPVIQIPVTAGPVCAIYNVPGVTTSLRLTGSTLAGIFLGQIINWQDPAIERENPGVRLPKAAIIVVHRSDGSGTTSILTDYLSKISSEWKGRASQGLSVSWPVGVGVDGSSAVLEFVKHNSGTIGYAELNYAKKLDLPVVSIQNRAGSFVVPSPASATAAIEAFAEALTKDARTAIVDPPASAKEAYPISGLTFLLAPKDGSGAEQRRVLRDFFQYAVTTGQDSAAFVDPKIPQKFAPYGIQTIIAPDGSETIWVTYTALDKAQSGFVDSFTPAGVLLSHFALSGPLHSPWGVALAPADFGPMSNALLVTNNAPRGRINAFDPKTGTFLGPLRDASGKAIEIDDVWAIQFGQGGPAGSNGNPNQLFFTAGNNNYGSGTFGVITFGQ